MWEELQSWNHFLLAVLLFPQDKNISVILWMLSLWAWNTLLYFRFASNNSQAAHNSNEVWNWTKSLVFVAFQITLTFLDLETQTQSALKQSLGDYVSVIPCTLCFLIQRKLISTHQKPWGAERFPSLYNKLFVWVVIGILDVCSTTWKNYIVVIPLQLDYSIWPHLTLAITVLLPLVTPLWKLWQLVSLTAFLNCTQQAWFFD